MFVRFQRSHEVYVDHRYDRSERRRDISCEVDQLRRFYCDPARENAKK